MMKKGLSMLLFVTWASASAVSADDRVERLPDDFKKWLEEDVVYIITGIEKDIFLDLTTREERDRFIEAFWARRDPDPATLENEFQREHYRRVEYANTVLGRESPRPGFRTDRGKYYIILGKPMEIQRYDGYNEVVSIEIWFYMGEPDTGTPPRFNLVFYKENDIGEYRLYHPFADGPQKLLRAGYATQYYQVQQNKAVDLLEVVGMDLARAALTIDLTENTAYDIYSARNSIEPLELSVRPAMNVDRTLADIDMSPLRRVDTRDLEGYKKFGHRVTADYSFKFFPSRSVHAVLYGPENVPFLHFGLEIDPSNFTLERNEAGTRHYTTLEVDLEVRDLEGRTIAHDVNRPLIELSASEFDKARSYPVAYRDDYPLIPGQYQVSVVVKNRATKDYTASEFGVEVSGIEPGKPALSDVVLAYDRDDAFAEGQRHRTFQIGSTEVHPSGENVFSSGATVHVLVQAIEAGPGYEVRFRVLDPENESIREERADASFGTVVQEIPLLGVAGGFYTLRVDLLGPDGSVVATRRAPFTVTPRNRVARPAFVYRKSFNTEFPGLLDLTLGNELMACGRVDKAEASFRKAVAAKNPELPMARWRLATIALFSRDADRALELLAPLENAHANELEVVEGLGFAYYIKRDFARAKDYLERSAAIRAPDTIALNALGDCYERLGKADEAKASYRRSLELNPDQPGVRARLAGLGEGDAQKD